MAHRGEITLFNGCLGNLLDIDTTDAAQRVLARLGYRVRMAPSALCCGTWPLHAGDAAAANTDAARCREVLAGFRPAPLVHLASGCEAGLRAALTETAAVWDICAFLAQDEQLASLPWRITHEIHVVLMVPCTQAALGGAEPVLRILRALPKVKVSVLPQQPRCCGAAGMQFIDHADLSDSLRDEKLAQIEALQPDVVLSGNHACRIHLRAGMGGRVRNVPVMHPVVFVESLCR
jgi:glycolate oxidase iron-sulfur subunit